MADLRTDRQNGQVVDAADINAIAAGANAANNRFTTFRINDLADVDGIPAGGNFLGWDASQSLWRPMAPPSGGTGGVTSVNGRTGAVTLGKVDVALGNVDNTADFDKPVSTAVGNALQGKADLVGGKVPASQLPTQSTGGAVSSVSGKTGAVTLVKADVGLGSVDNTADVDKPVSTAQAAADAAAIHKTGAETAAGVKTFTDGLVIPAGGTISVPDNSLSYADVAGLVARLAAIEANIATLQANSIAAFVPAGSSPPTGLPNGAIGAYELAAAADPLLVGYAPVAPAGATNFVVALPSGSQVGDMLAVPHMHAQSSNPDYYFMPSGFTGIATSSISTTSRLEVYGKALTSADITTGSITITFASTQKPAAAALVVRNAALPTAAIVASTTSGITTLTPPAVSLAKRSLVFTLLGKRVTGATFTGTTVPSGQAQMGTEVSTGSASGGETALIAAQYVAVQGPGTVTPSAYTLNAAATGVFAASIVFPAAA
jgi:hypothetical protein